VNILYNLSQDFYIYRYNYFEKRVSHVLRKSFTKLQQHKFIIALLLHYYYKIKKNAKPNYLNSPFQLY